MERDPRYIRLVHACFLDTCPQFGVDLGSRPAQRRHLTENHGFNFPSPFIMPSKDRIKALNTAIDVYNRQMTKMANRSQQSNVQGRRLFTNENQQVEETTITFETLQERCQRLQTILHEETMGNF